MRRVIPKLLSTLCTASLYALAQCQWVEESYSVTIQQAKILTSAIFCTNSGPVVWNTGSENWFYVVGSPTQDPPWRALFASLCQNDWSESGPVWSATCNMGDSIYNYDNCELRQGSEVFWYYSGGSVTDTAERDIARNGGPGYHVTDHYSYEIKAGGGGGSN